MVMDVTYDDYLAHHGVKGMKWGVRRSSKRTKKRPSNRKQGRNDAKKAREIEKRAGYYSKEAKEHRRKVANKKKQSEEYKKAYDKNVSNHNDRETTKIYLGVAAAGDILFNQGRGTMAVAKMGLSTAGTAYNLGAAAVNSYNNVDRSHVYINPDGSVIRRPKPNFASGAVEKWN